MGINTGNDAFTVHHEFAVATASAFIPPHVKMTKSQCQKSNGHIPTDCACPWTHHYCSHRREEELKGLDFLLDCRYNLTRWILVPNKSAELKEQNKKQRLNWEAVQLILETVVFSREEEFLTSLPAARKLSPALVIRWYWWSELECGQKNDISDDRSQSQSSCPAAPRQLRLLSLLLLFFPLRVGKKMLVFM